MKMTDKLNIEIDYRDALRLYLILGRVNGPTSVKLWDTLRGVLDEDRKLFDHFSSTVERDQTLNYNSYYYYFEDKLFSPKKSPEQLQLESVMNSIADLQEQAKKLQEIIESK